jgi:hypothetical protein
MFPLELAATGASLVGSEPLNGLRLFVFGEEPCRRNVVVEFPIDERCRNDGDEPNKEEDAKKRLDSAKRHRSERVSLHLPLLQKVGFNMSQTVR